MSATGDISVNRKALRDFHILERFEAGLALRGTEVKSIRAGRANVGQAFARIENGQAMLYDVDIQPYEKASHVQHDARRVRKLLLHRKEITKLIELSEVDGCTLVALRMYWKDAFVKVEIGVGKGKHAADKREDLKEKVERREMDREVARFNKKHAY